MRCPFSPWSSTWRARSATFEVRNLFDQPLPIELRVQGVRFTETGLEGDGVDRGDLVVVPPQALIAPGRTQTCRVQFVGAPPAQTSQHYFVTVAQLPVEIEGRANVQVLYNFNVLISVPLTGASPDIHVVSVAQATNEQGGRELDVLFENTAPTYGYVALGRLRLEQRGPDGRELMRQTLESGELGQSVGTGLIGPLQRRRFRVHVVTPDATAPVTGEFINARG